MYDIRPGRVVKVEGYNFVVKADDTGEEFACLVWGFRKISQLQPGFQVGFTVDKKNPKQAYRIGTKERWDKALAMLSQLQPSQPASDIREDN